MARREHARHVAHSSPRRVCSEREGLSRRSRGAHEVRPGFACASHRRRRCPHSARGVYSSAPAHEHGTRHVAPACRRPAHREVAVLSSQRVLQAQSAELARIARRSSCHAPPRLRMSYKCERQPVQSLSDEGPLSPLVARAGPAEHRWTVLLSTRIRHVEEHEHAPAPGRSGGYGTPDTHLGSCLLCTCA